MSKWTFERAGYLAGAAVPLLGMVGFAMNESGKGSWPGDIDSEIIQTSELVDYYSGNTTSRFSYMVLIAAVAALAWFISSLRTRFLRAEPAPGNLARTAAGIGMVSVLAWLSLIVLYGGAERYDAARIDPAFLQGFFATETMLDGLWFLAVLPMPFLLAIAAYLGIRHGALPRTLCWAAVAAAAPGLTGALLWPVDKSPDGLFNSLVWIGSLAFLLWCLVAGSGLAWKSSAGITGPEVREADTSQALVGV